MDSRHSKWNIKMRHWNIITLYELFIVRHLFNWMLNSIRSHKTMLNILQKRIDFNIQTTVTEKTSLCKVHQLQSTPLMVNKRILLSSINFHDHFPRTKSNSRLVWWNQILQLQSTWFLLTNGSFHTSRLEEINSSRCWHWFQQWWPQGLCCHELLSTRQLSRSIRRKCTLIEVLIMK